MSVEVLVCSCVEELGAVTVAPAIGVFPDFTTPTMERFGAVGRSCARETPTTSSRNAICRAATTHVLEPMDTRTPQGYLARLLMRGADELREPLIYSTR